MEIVLLYIFVAAAAGIMTGLLGGGIGLLLIPVIALILNMTQVPAYLIMHIAIGSTAASFICMGAFASFNHYRRGSINLRLWRKMLLGIMVGVVIGAFIADFLPSKTLMWSFGLLMLVLAVYTTLGKTKEASDGNPVHIPALLFHGISFVIGIVGGILGVNAFAVPFFKRIGVSIHTAIGTAAAIGTCIASSITVMYMITGWSEPNLPPLTTGYVDWKIVFPIAIISVLFTPLGTRLAHWFPKKLLSILYSLLLLVIGVKMFLAGIRL